MTEIETHWSGTANAVGTCSEDAKTTYRVVDGFQRFPLGLVLVFQLGVGVRVKFLEFLNHL